MLDALRAEFPVLDGRLLYVKPPSAGPARLRNSQGRVVVGCGRARRKRLSVPRQTNAAGRREAIPFAQCGERPCLLVIAEASAHEMPVLKSPARRNTA